MPLSFPVALGLLFIGLKLGGVIAWSWVWVLAPFWVGLAIGLALFVFCGAIVLIVGAKFGAHRGRAAFLR